MVMIPPTHPICSKTVQSVDYKISDTCDRSDIVLSGKKKRGKDFRCLMLLESTNFLLYRRNCNNLATCERVIKFIIYIPDF